MVFDDIQEFISFLEAGDDLRRIRVDIDPELEISAITDRVSKTNNNVLFFERVKGYEFPIVTNIFGSLDRVALSLNADNLTLLGEKLFTGVKSIVDPPMLEFMPKQVSVGPCQKNIIKRDGLSRIPALKSWPLDAGRYLTLPLVITRDPAGNENNCGIYRVQIIDEKRALINFGENSDGGRHLQKYQESGERMPVAIALGGPPALIYSACAPVPKGIDELHFSGILRGRSIEVVECLSTPLHVPAKAEFIVEGYIEPGETDREGPFGNHTGYYSKSKPQPVLHVTAISHRDKPICPCTVVGQPPMEDCFLAKASERIFLPLLQKEFPQIRELNFVIEGIFHGFALVSIRKRKNLDVQALVKKMKSHRWMGNFKFLVFLDDDVDVRDVSFSFWRAINHIFPEEDLMIIGDKVVIDATRKERSHEKFDLWPQPIAVREDIQKLISRRWAEYGID